MKKILAILGVIFFLLLVGIGGLIWWEFQPVTKNMPEETFMVKKGDSFGKIAARLEKEGYVKSALSLRFLAFQKQNVIIQPGTYNLSSSQTPGEIFSSLLSDTQDVWVTLLEGWRAEEIAHELASKLSSQFNEDDFLTKAKPLEGTLFPDTYLLPRDVGADYVLSLLTNTFEKRFASLKTGAETSLNREATITLASLVEREARVASEKPIVAGILLNRLRADMPLQVDATLQYARGYDAQKQTWWPVPKATDKELNSPFNTYANKGLPPHPICNPGLVALQAATTPDVNEFYYYLSDNKDGTLYFAKTYDEHLQNIEKYLR